MTEQPSEHPQPFKAIVLAAGEGTRMRSAKPKVLHHVAGRSMVGHVLTALAGAGAAGISVVIGPDRDDVAKEVLTYAPHARTHVQHERRGTAHAVLAAREDIAAGGADILVAFGDTPLIRPETLARLRAELRGDVAVAVLGFEAADPHGYGRLVRDGDTLVAIREERDASPAEREIRLCNAGLMALSGVHAMALLESIGNANAKGEFYLTDAVEMARSRGLRCAVTVALEDEVLGINDRVQLAAAEAALQARLRREAMLGGATLQAPETVFLSADTRLGRDVVVEPHVVFGPGVVVEEGAVVHAFSHLEGARLRQGAEIGPYARLRPGADVGEGARVGNFVELKNVSMGPGAKANHLAYLGDGSVGAGANIGAGTIFCNYDGIRKSRTTIGDGAFIGSNSSLVAPVSVGDGAYVGTGSVVTDDVPADALVLARARQTVKPTWAVTFRARRAALKTKG